ncbi:MAG: TadE family protein, partial [Candidatus Deferrimicrobiota bacterium]
MRAKRIRNTLEHEKGQSLVEFALVVPMLLLLVFGIAEFGRAWMTQNILTGAAREAVRLLAVPAPPGGPAAANARAIAVLASAGITTATISVNNALVAFDNVSVTVTYNFPVLTGLIPGLGSRLMLVIRM